MNGFSGLRAANSSSTSSTCSGAFGRWLSSPCQAMPPGSVVFQLRPNIWMSSGYSTKKRPEAAPMVGLLTARPDSSGTRLW